MNITTSFLLLLSALMAGSGQLLMKRASAALAHIFEWDANGSVIGQIVRKLFTVIFEPHVLIAFILYFSSSFLWLKILSRTELSLAYPILLSLMIILTTIASMVFFQESFTLSKLFGIFFIMIGIALILNFKLSSG